MTRWSALLVLAPLCLLGATCSAQAQFSLRPGISAPPASPAYSPYLNLLRPGGNLVQNYFGLVQPEFRTLNAVAGLQTQVNDAQASQGGSAAALPATGHTATFLNTRGYFLTLGSGGGQSSTRIGAGPGGGGAAGGAAAGVRR